jgi:hypothetical protein
LLIPVFKVTWKTSEAAWEKFATENWGIRGKWLLRLPMELFMPCMMHTMMVITKKLFSLLALESRGKKSISVQWEELLHNECGIDMVEGAKTFYDWWEKTSINRPQALAILSNAERFINILQECSPKRPAWVEQISIMWRRYYNLTTLLTQASVNVREETWREEARRWGRLVVHLYGKEEVTPYIHIFIYHLGYFLERYSGLEKFTNFVLEGKHTMNKKMFQSAMNRFKHGEAGGVRQQLQGNLW